MPKQLTKEQFLQRSAELHNNQYDYSKVCYTNSTTKVVISCKKHGDFEMTPKAHLIGQGCRKCGYEKNQASRSLTQDQFIERSHLAHGNKYDYSKSIYTNSQAKVTIICPDHGEFQQQAGHHMNGIGCKRCGVESAQAKTRTTLDEFVAKAREVHGDKYDYSQVDYQGTMVKVKIICPKHGVFEQVPMDHLKGRGCWACTGLKKRTQEEFIAQSKAIWGNKYDYSEVVYRNHESKVILTCDQGHRFEQLVSSHLNGFNCPHCSGLARKTTEEFVAEAKAKFGDKFDYSKVEYVNSRTPVTIICPIVGEFQQEPIAHLMSKTGYTIEHSAMFADVFRQEPQTTEYFIKRAKEVHGDTYDYSKSVYLNIKDNVEIICAKHGSFWQAPHNHYKGAGCPTCALGTTESKPERILKEALAEFKPVKTDQVLTGLKEIDIYFPEHKVAVEVNGLYWHSDMKAKTKTTHRQKYLECCDLGIKLMQFTDKEILKKPEIVASMVKNALGASMKMNARSLAVRKVSHKDYMDFFNTNHISGGVSAKMAFGLYCGDELVSCMSFNKSRFSEEYEWEIIRFSNKIGITVRGAASRLFAAFVKGYKPKSVMSYADLRFGNGKVYEKLGFEYIKDTDVGYAYHHGNGKVISRYQAQKHKLPELLGEKFDHELSERDNMLKSGYYKMFDCGNKVYGWFAPDS